MSESARRAARRLPLWEIDFTPMGDSRITGIPTSVEAV